VPDRLSIHAPILVNTIGHCAGAIAFGILLYLLLRQRDRSLLPSIAAGLALLWNVGSLIGLATLPGNAVSDAIVAASFSVLSLLPAVLLHISLQSARRPLVIGGYVVSSIAVALHIVDVVTGAPRFHYAAILVVTIGFGVLTAISVVLESVTGARLAGTMVLFLFAISFAHFESAHDAWSGEIALHHAGIPLALFVLLQDYRFLLLDAFIRFLVNGILAAFTVLVAFEVNLTKTREDPFYAGIVFTLACLALGLFAWARSSAQRFLTRAVFLRSSVDHSISRLRDSSAFTAEGPYLESAGAIIADFLSAQPFEFADEESLPPSSIPGRGKLWRHCVSPVAMRGCFDSVHAAVDAVTSARTLNCSTVFPPSPPNRWSESATRKCRNSFRRRNCGPCRLKSIRTSSSIRSTRFTA
jgi:hypothetical protein